MRTKGGGVKGQKICRRILWNPANLCRTRLCDDDDGEMRSRSQSRAERDREGERERWPIFLRVISDQLARRSLLPPSRSLSYVTKEKGGERGRPGWLGPSFDGCCVCRMMSYVMMPARDSPSLARLTNPPRPIPFGELRHF